MTPLSLTWLDPYLPGVALSRSPELEEAEDLASAGISRVSCLQEAGELAWFGHTMLERRWAMERAGMVFVHEPVEDFAAPTLAQVRRVVAMMGPGSTGVLVHCQAGLGRAGTMAACAPVGFGVHGAISMVRHLRPGAVQSEAQERCVAAFAEGLS